MNFGWIDTLRSPTNREIFQVEPLGRLGEWSDDTQLTLAVANGIIQAGGFDIDAQVKHLIQAHDASPHVRYFDNRNLGGRLMPRGWGYNTTDSVLRLKEGVSPSESGGKNALTNGVLMKLAPLVYLQHVRNTPSDIRYEQLDALTRMTHYTAEAMTFSRVHGDVLSNLLSNDGHIQTSQNFAEFAISRARRHEKAVGSKPLVSEALGFLSALESASFADVLKHTDKKGFEGHQTLAMAYGFFLSGKTFSERVYAGVNGGGDTDSIASIAGTMSLFSDGFVDFPPDVENIIDIAMLRSTSRTLTDCALQTPE